MELLSYHNTLALTTYLMEWTKLSRLFDADGHDVCLWLISGWIVRSESSPQFNLPLIKAGALGSLKYDSWFRLLITWWARCGQWWRLREELAHANDRAVPSSCGTHECGKQVTFLKDTSLVLLSFYMVNVFCMYVWYKDVLNSYRASEPPTPRTSPVSWGCFLYRLF